MRKLANKLQIFIAGLCAAASIHDFINGATVWGVAFALFAVINFIAGLDES